MMKFNLLSAMVFGIAIVLFSSSPIVLAQLNASNQTGAPTNLSENSGQANLSTTSLDAQSNMSSIPTPEGDVNTYR